MKSMFKGALSALIVVLALSGLTAASALAAGPPIVETKGASSISESAADVAGSVNPNGESTKYGFEYGTSISYGKKSKEAVLAAGTSPVEVAKILSELAPGTTYHYRIFASNSSGTVYGAGKEFKTLSRITGLPEFTGMTSSALMKIELKNIEINGESKAHPIICQKASGEGKLAEGKYATAKFDFSGCELYDVDWLKCHTEGAEAGVILSYEVPLQLVYTNKSTKEVGLAFNPKNAGASGETFIPEVRCGVWKTGLVYGQFVAPISKYSINKKSYEFGTNFQQSNSKPSPAQYENNTGELENTFMNYFNIAGDQESAFATSTGGELLTNWETELKA